MVTNASKHCVQVCYVIPSAINCFFHIYEETLGTYGFRVLRHVLGYPGQHASVGKTGCDQDVDQHAYVTVSNDIVVDRTWCRACAATVDKEDRRRNSPTRYETRERP